ncbi:LOW QUALITY PROTEIN: hypothetical protein Cgig2_009288 [Carnegiea gigantea]|uniref:Uncharacterized protein n=1 Tax=Carnegiea gigantea TaxID=171969 RepID=A0A9Q1GLW7_9CARY|nr:LOW QUALITY PROTEIN: hypothetical protein Cgig2_009288 [Carnegiea gigantea]
MAISSSKTFKGSEAPGAARSQDLTISWTRESLTLASALMKLAEGRGVSQEAPLATGVTAPVPWEGVGRACLAGVRFPDLRFPDCRRTIGPRSPYLRRSGRPSLTRGSLNPLLLADQQAHGGPPPARYKGGRLNKELPLFLPLKLGSGCHLFGSGIPSLKDRSQISTKHRTSQYWNDYIPLVKFLRISRPAVARKKLLIKNFSLGSQFNGSRPLHRLNCLSYEPRDGPRLIVLAYIEHKVVGRASFLSRGFPEGAPNRKRKSYFQYFSFNFFSMAVMKPDLLLKQYHPKTPVSLGAFWTRVGAPGNSNPSATISVTGGIRPVCLGTELTGPHDDSVEELVKAPYEDELREEFPEAELREPDREEVLELKEATSASGLD